MTLYIKNMVCDRCILVVQNELVKLGLDISHIKLGEVTLTKDLAIDIKPTLEKVLNSLGFELIDSKRNQIIEKIKNVIIDLVHHQDLDNKLNLSTILSQELHQDYTYLSNLFSESEHTTIEKFFIAQKIEKVKELMEYGELSLSEIAFKLHYSSVSYLSNQFKKNTGLTPSQFRKSKNSSRIALDKL